MLNPRKELKREQRARSGEWRVNIFFSGRIPRDTGGSAALSFLTNTKKDPESIIPSPFGCNSPYRRKPVKGVPSFQRAQPFETKRKLFTARGGSYHAGT